ncbi:MAG TPA: ATP/GTP-binding protein [Pseudonocardiaceae bacterium]|jgi:hypothetical protein|nr:ATP/GTP-binding protein [Pseudonocardiaceae bacterium]
MDRVGSGQGTLTSAKIVITGGLGTGKSTFLGSLTDAMPLPTAVAVPDTIPEFGDYPGVLTDFGRVPMDADLVLYLFATPGQQRFRSVWDELARAAIGAVVLVDPHRLAESSAAVDYFAGRGLPYVLAVNAFGDRASGGGPDVPHLVRRSLRADPDVPVVTCDARDRRFTKAALTTLVEHAMR